MNSEELQNHPAFKRLTKGEQDLALERLNHWHLKDEVVAAGTGDIQNLEVEDLRIWLAESKSRPWAMAGVAIQTSCIEFLPSCSNSAPGFTT